MKKIYKHLLILGVLIVVSIVVYQSISKNQYQNWVEQQAEIQIDFDKFENILSDAGYKIENKQTLEVKKISQTRFGNPINAWYVYINVDDSIYVLHTFEYASWEEAHGLVVYQTQWRKDTFQAYKGHFFSHGTFAIEIDPGNIELQKELIEILMEAEN